MNIDRTVRRIVATLPRAWRQKLAEVTICHRPVPTAHDLERGATRAHRGYFFGAALDHVEGAELPDEDPPRGEIVIFTDKIWPPTEQEIARVILHELAHALGYDHDVIEDELGLGVQC